MPQRDQLFALSIVRHHGAQPLAVREIVGLGSVNHVFVVDTEAGDRWVVRFGRDPLDTNHFPKEAMCLTAAAQHGLPVPRLVALGETDGIPYLVQEFIEGSQEAHAFLQNCGGPWATMPVSSTRST